MDKKYDHQQTEQEIQKKWQSEETYSLKNNPGELYSIDTPPPTVSGSLHIGHIFSYTQTDIIARFKRMSGYSVFYPIGFDDNGLATERFVEKKRGIAAYQMARSEFIKICLEETAEAEKQFEQLWKKVGLSVDWSKPYSTISDSSRRISQESFIRLFEKGYIYRKNETAPYCTSCYTSVAQAELDDLEVNSFFNDIVFKLADGTDLVIGTTRPELLASCVALFYNPNDSRYQHLKGKNAIVPIYGYEVPILPDEHVNPEKGTGLVMCCTFGDKTDIIWYKKFNLPYKQSVGRDGRWTEITGPLKGLKVHEARKKILELLKEQSLLLNQKPITHAVNVHERCKKEIEYIEIPQWFIKILDYKDKFIKLADEINWHPQFMKSRYINWVENLSWDWCISRQRFYGIPFPVWHCEDCKEIILANIKDLPIDPRENNLNNCPKCNSTNIVADTDVMDTWNTSSLTPQICYEIFSNKNPFENEIKKFLPMSMRPQAHDIIRTWAFDTIVKSWMHHDTIPWKEIVISGHVLSSAKEKLSKSKGNESTTPENLLSKYSADVVRFWTASGTLGHDTAFSETQLNIGQRLVTKLWNAFRFIEEHLQNFEQQKPLMHCFGTDVKNISGLQNEWLLHKSTECFKNYQKYFNEYEFSLALDSVEKFFWQDFCDNYLEIIKDQLFNPDKYSAEEVYATKACLFDIGLRILQLYAPYLPFITESIFESVYKNKIKIDSIHLTKFVNVQKEYNFESSAQIMERVLNIVAQVRKLKTEHKVALNTELSELAIYSENKNELDAIKILENLIKGVTKAKSLNYVIEKLNASEMKQVDSNWYVKVAA